MLNGESNDGRAPGSIIILLSLGEKRIGELGESNDGPDPGSLIILESSQLTLIPPVLGAVLRALAVCLFLAMLYELRLSICFNIIQKHL